MAGLGADAVWMSDTEALMWRLERHDARLRPVITAVALLDRSPGVDLVARRARALVDAEPRFAARVAPAATGLAPPRLVADEELDLAQHVRVVGAPGAGGLEDLLGMVAPWVADGVDLSRPLWRLTLVEGMAGGRAALVPQVHHCLVDGMGLVALAAVLFGAAGGSGRAGGGSASPGDGPLPGTGWDAWVPGAGAVASSAVALAADVTGEARRAWRSLRRAGPVLAGLGRRAVVDPEAEATRLVDQAASVARALDPSGRPRSPLLVGRSGNAALGAVAVPLDAVRAAGRCTVNDVFVDAVAEGLRRYHAKHGAAPERLRVGIPIDRGPGSGGGANHFVPARLDLPLQLPPAERIAAIHDLVADARRAPAVAAWPALAGAAARLPGAEALLARGMRSLDAVASNVPGSAEPVHLGAARVLGIVPFGPRSGAACNVTTTSYDGMLHIGITVDPVAAGGDPGTLLGCLTGALTDIPIDG